VVGGAGLLGSEICKALASAGAKSIILDIDRKKGLKLEKDINNAGQQANFEYFNAINLKTLDRRISSLIKKYKSVDVWVNAAYPRTKDWDIVVEKLRLSSWRKNVDMHLNSYAWASRTVALMMKKFKISGSIVNLGSIYGVQGVDFTIYEGTKMTCPMTYSAIKGSIVNLTRYLASYFGRYGIRINTVNPGGVFDKQNKKFLAKYESKVPLKRMARTDEIAPVVLFLASEASSYITGATIMVDGGWTIV